MSNHLRIDCNLFKLLHNHSQNLKYLKYLIDTIKKSRKSKNKNNTNISKTIIHQYHDIDVVNKLQTNCYFRISSEC